MFFRKIHKWRIHGVVTSPNLIYSEQSGTVEEDFISEAEAKLRILEVFHLTTPPLQMDYSTLEVKVLSITYVGFRRSGLFK